MIKNKRYIPLSIYSQIVLKRQNTKMEWNFYLSKDIYDLRDKIGRYATHEEKEQFHIIKQGINLYS